MVHRTRGAKDRILDKILRKLLKIGVCGGWVFTKTSEICIHGQHEKPWQFVSETGLDKDRSFRVQQDCDVPRLLKQR